MPSLQVHTRETPRPHSVQSLRRNLIGFLRLGTASQGWLRELVWISDDVQRLRKTIITAIPDFRHLLEKEPLFCFDEAAKLLLWSDLVYTIEDKAKAPGGE